MGIFGKINSSSSEECLLSQQITKYIKESSSIQAYCIKDLVILEADGTGVVDYCPNEFGSINIEDSYCFKVLKDRYGDKIVKNILDFIKKNINIENINILFDNKNMPFKNLYPKVNAFMIWLNEKNIYINGFIQNKVVAGSPPVSISNLNPINDTFQNLLIIDNEIYYAIEDKYLNIEGNSSSEYLAEMIINIDNSSSTIGYGIVPSSKISIFKIDEFYYFFIELSYIAKFKKCDENFKLDFTVEH